MAGVDEGVMSTIRLTVFGVGVATGVALVETGLVHPLMKTMPVTRTVKIPIVFHFLISRTCADIVYAS